MKYIHFQAYLISFLLLTVFSGSAVAQNIYAHTFFKGTQYPLRVTWIKGDVPGPTIMVQGGIQGDEISGFFTAQLLTKARVTKGNLIIVPRANEPSILKRRRQINVDLNRRFDRDYNNFFEDRLARAIRFLVGQADGFIHLHEGSGFYCPKYESVLRNPNRYGQSFIIDTEVYKGKIHLADMCLKAIAHLNRDIPNKNYHFNLFNTDTFAKATHYPEMRKSLTFYTLVERGIPAMAVEVSKDIMDVDWKVHQQLKATVLLLKEFGLELEVPNFSLPKGTKGEKISISINGRPLAGSSLNLAQGSIVETSGREIKDNGLDPAIAVYASDRPEINLLSAPRMALSPFHTLEVNIDGDRLSTSKINWKGFQRVNANSQEPVFVCWLNGKVEFVPASGTLKAVKGDQIILEGVMGSQKEEVLNLKGFVASTSSNDGQDVGYEIIADPGNFMDKYKLSSSGGSNSLYRVVRETPGVKRTHFDISIRPRKIEAIKLTAVGSGSFLMVWQSNSGRVLPPGEYVLDSVWSNGKSDKIQPFVSGLPVDWGKSFTIEKGQTLNLDLRQATTFSLLGKMELRGSDYIQADAKSVYSAEVKTN